jgi:hypothetical protein
MIKYTVHFSNGTQDVWDYLDAETPEEALAFARSLCELEAYEGMKVRTVSIFDVDGNDVAFWQDDELRLLHAASDLLEALEAICDLPADDAGDRTIPAGFLDQARAAIAEVKGGGP